MMHKLSIRRPMKIFTLSGYGWSDKFESTPIVAKFFCVNRRIFIFDEFVVRLCSLEFSIAHTKKNICSTCLPGHENVNWIEFLLKNCVRGDVADFSFQSLFYEKIQLFLDLKTSHRQFLEIMYLKWSRYGQSMFTPSFYQIANSKRLNNIWIHISFY